MDKLQGVRQQQLGSEERERHLDDSYNNSYNKTNELH